MCRVFDTCYASAGALTANTEGTFATTDNVSFVSQGGNAAGCGIVTDPAAVVVTLTGVVDGAESLLDMFVREAAGTSSGYCEADGIQQATESCGQVSPR